VPSSQAVVQSINPAQDALYVQLLDGGINRVLRVPYGPHPQAEEVVLPVKGSASTITDPRLPGALFGLTSWTQAFKIYAYDPEIKRMTDTKLQPTGPYDNPTNITSAEVKVRSYDGTLVPLSIVYPKNVKLDGSNPTLLGGYGAYGFSSTPYFDPTRIAWYENGGIRAVCHVRGGGEYGEEWHLAGKGPTKPNTWRGFIACAQYLIDKKYTSPAHLAGAGGSAGGILIGRAITSRPDLFAAAIDIVGDSDALRIETTANGVPNIPEFGSVKTEAGFKALYAMSSYHHVKDGTAYPAVLLETGANDPRVDPWQSAKMTARLQAATASGKPVLLRVEYHGGHGGIGGTEKQAQIRMADEWSFLLWRFGMPGFQPPKQ
jgi:prolyl oligopeptidase